MSKNWIDSFRLIEDAPPPGVDRKPADPPEPKHGLADIVETVGSMPWREGDGQTYFHGWAFRDPCGECQGLNYWADPPLVCGWRFDFDELLAYYEEVTAS